jgi:transglutaminase-like putative cysteine protease
MRVRVGCRFLYDAPRPVPLLMAIQPPPHAGHRLVQQSHTLCPQVPLHTYGDSFGNTIWRLVIPVGALRIVYEAIADVPSTPDPVLLDLPRTPIEQLPDAVVVYTLPSRYCPSDLFINDAWALFGERPDGWPQVQAVCDWLHAHIIYGAGSLSSTSAWDSYQQRRGVCRDFAHLGVAFCRALNYPARYVCGYLPDIGVPVEPTPMDFHAWFEVYLAGAWRTFDARHNRPRTGRVRIATGRDAVDVAFATLYGPAHLRTLQVWADAVPEDVHLEGQRS